MIGYITLGTNDLPAALQFYDALIETVGGKVVSPHPSGGRMYGSGAGSILLGVIPPYNGGPATAGNGTMVAFGAESRGKVDEIHAKALSLGATDEGAPGIRGTDPNGFYGAYFRDLDGNKLCAFRFGPA